MVDTFLKVINGLGRLIAAYGNAKDEASLASRKALTLAASYVGDRSRGMPADRKAEKEIAMACSTAGSKLRRISPELAKEFNDFGLFWAAGTKDQEPLNTDQLLKYVGNLDELLFDRCMESE